MLTERECVILNNLLHIWSSLSLFLFFSHLFCRDTIWIARFFSFTECNIKINISSSFALKFRFRLQNCSPALEERTYTRIYALACIAKEQILFLVSARERSHVRCIALSAGISHPVHSPLPTDCSRTTCDARICLSWNEIYSPSPCRIQGFGRSYILMRYLVTIIALQTSRFVSVSVKKVLMFDEI